MFSSMAIFGLGIGGMMFLQNFIWADYFGRERVGAIRGFAMPINLHCGWYRRAHRRLCARVDRLL